jgi:tetratricopeptide (TPR) repeat protein
VLTVQVGIANSYMNKGNLPQAQAILDDVVVQARDQELPEVQAYALHSRAAIAHQKGDFSDALKLAYEALGLTTNPTERDSVLEDIGAMFTSLGLRDAARDSHLVLAGTAQSQMVRATANINLMELAAVDGMPEAFDAYARQLAQVKLSPWLRAHYLLCLGEGMNCLGRSEPAEDALKEAISFAEANQIHQISFKAQAMLTAMRSAPRTIKPFVATPSWVPEEINTVVRAMSELRKTAAAAA